MNLTRSLNRLLVAGTAALLLGMPNLAQAQLGKVDGPGPNLGTAVFDYASAKFGFGSVSYSATAQIGANIYNASGGAAGIFDATTKIGSNTIAKVSVCNDLFNFVQSPPVNMSYHHLTADLNTNRYQIARLVDNVMGSDAASFLTTSTSLGATFGTNTDKSAGFQLAIWELWYDDGANLTAKGLTLGRGFSAAGTSADILSNAQAYLTYASAASSTPSLTALRLIGTGFTPQSTVQGMLISSDSPIPEPAFYQMAGLLTMGIIGMRRLRKKA